jgi:Raf kinase inhibitor-like YbhB/YbcL family protein
MHKRLLSLAAAVAAAAFLFSSCGSAEPAAAPDEAVMTVTSPAFTNGGAIPVKYTCDGEDISPALSWSGAPSGTLSSAIVMDDPDAPGGTFTHWLVYDIPAVIHGLPEAAPAMPEFETGMKQGNNGFGKTGYGGPCPPKGSSHHYVFTVYALDITIDLPAGASKSQVLAAIEGHILGRGQLTGTFRH